MAIQGVDTKCYILALFVRDDGERFLLGSGHYEFKNTQMHFAANAIQNDIVEVQGNDGFLLAGQVRRPGTQSFDGYVGDGTMSKEETESYRRQFFSFFRKNFFYKVIYVFSNGTAIQRKSGFLVDDPTVEELYQMYPEYHVALNFEDVNYYSYSEDEEGQEQYAKEATIDTSSMRATGGLVWDNLGVVWEDTQWGGEQTASGTEMTIQNDMSVMSIVDDIRLDGDTYQQSYSGKNLFKPQQRGSASNGITSTVNADNSITCSGTATGTYADITAQIAVPISVPSGTTVTFSIAEAVPITLRASFGGVWLTINAGSTSGANTTTANSSNTYITSSVTNGTTYNFTIKNPMIEVGSTATPFEPYTGGIPAPNPDYPQDIQTVTGEQTVTVSDGANSQSYTVSLGSTELCKLGDYQDYIYKSGNDWYVHKATKIVTFNGTEAWDKPQSDNVFRLPGSYSDMVGAAVAGAAISDFFVFWPNSGGILNNLLNGQFGFVGTLTNINFRYDTTATISAWKTWLTNHNVSVYYALATPIDTQITNTALVEQLDALGAMKLFIGENNLIVQSTGTNLPAPLSFKYYTTVAMTGAEWEEGGSGGATVVEVDSITNTYPIWRVKGPAVNPQLSVINTNTTIRYTGTVTSTQTLEIDMFNKTAKLNGVSVIGNVSGDWVSLAPGTNRVIYTAENADAQPSTIEWQEVVG